MNTLDRKTVETHGADIVVLDADDIPIMLVEIKARHEDSPYDQEQLVQSLQEAVDIPYAMLVTLRSITLYEWRAQTLHKLLEAPTADVLLEYEPEFREKTIYDYYLGALVESWLRDVAYHWKSETPPLWNPLSQIGLIAKLNDGTTYSQTLLPA